MPYSRQGRFEERSQKRQLTFAVAGTAVLLLFLAFFGLKILVSFSLLVDKLRGASPTSQTTQVLLQPPVLDPLPVATNSATSKVTGKAQPTLSLIIYLNETESKTISVPDDGKFELTDITLKEGSNTLSAKTTDNKGGFSELSNVITTIFQKNPPTLEISSPDDHSSVSGDNSTITISGQTNEDNSLTINGRLVIVNHDGSFSHQYRLNEGDNTLKIVATDQAGNQTTVERQVKYQK